MLAVSCGFEETVVTNIIHEDGSVTRMVSTKFSKREAINIESLGVPVDSTWSLDIDWEFESTSDSIARDTTWLLKAQKHFKSVEEINLAYRNDIGKNRELQRRVSLTSSFRWFTTVYRYSETVFRTLEIEYPLSNSLTEPELQFAYWPAKVQNSALNSVDSLRFKEISDKAEEKTEEWYYVCLIKQWLHSMNNLIAEIGEVPFTKEDFLLKEERIIQNVIKDLRSTDFDVHQLFKQEFGEEFMMTYENEIDSAQEIMQNQVESFYDATGYEMQVLMPGKIIATNGYFAETEIDSVSVLWTVDPMLFLAEDYEMWVESRVHNYWLWVVTAIFLSFVTLGLIRKRKRQTA